MSLTILVAEDDLGTRTAIGDYLEVLGYSVLLAANGRMALQLVERYQPHLLITDITMPYLDGYTLVQQVRQRPASRLLPVIFLTARTETPDRIRGYQAGCDVYLSKPFELPELGAVVRNLLERWQMMAMGWQSQSASDSSPDVTQVETPIEIDLTSREQEVIQLLAAGLSNNQVGDRLHLSPRTVEKYVSSLLRKTNANNRAELVRVAIEHHWVAAHYIDGKSVIGPTPKP